MWSFPSVGLSKARVKTEIRQLTLESLWSLRPLPVLQFCNGGMLWPVFDCSGTGYLLVLYLSRCITIPSRVTSSQSGPRSRTFWCVAPKEYFERNNRHKETMTHSMINANCFFISTYSRADNMKHLNRRISFQWKSSHLEKFWVQN